MRGVSRSSLDEVVRRFDGILPSANAATLGHELFEVVAVLEEEHSLRRWLADPANEAESKSALISELLESKVSPATVLVVSDIVQSRWAGARDLVNAVEQLAVYATVGEAEDAQRLSELEDEIFRFRRIVAAEPELRASLVMEGVAASHKRTLVENLLSGKVNAATLRLVSEAVTRSRGRTLEQGLEHYEQLVAQRAQRYIAVVRTAVSLSENQQTRLQDALSRAYGRSIHLNIEIAPEIVGGLSIRVGDEVIDGTISGRLAEVRRRLAG